MSQRERQTPVEGGTAAGPPAAIRPSLWEDWFLRASAAEQCQALEVARNQGFLYHHQLPAPANGTSNQSLLNALLGGQSIALPSSHPPALDGACEHLEADQREAVARALHTPDLCLIQGPPGAGKSRVVTEIIARSTARGERVLFVAATPAAIDVVLADLPTVDGLCPIRCLGTEERIENLTPDIRRLLFTERVRHFQEHTLATARQAVAAAIAEVAAHQREVPVWARLEDLAATHEKFAAENALWLERRQQLMDPIAEVPNPSPSYRTALAECRRRQEEALACFDEGERTLQTETEKARAELQSITLDLDALTPLATARQRGQWWTVAWWRSLFRADVAARFAQLQQSRDDLLVALARLEKQASDLASALECRLVQARAEQAALGAQERAAQLVPLEAEISRIAAACREVTAAWTATLQELSGKSVRPAMPAAAAVKDAVSRWQRDRYEAIERQAFAERWCKDAEEAAKNLPARLTACANLVAATVSGLDRDPIYGESRDRPLFDLLVLEDADQITEAEFQALARRARRWVLVGMPERLRAAVPGRQTVAIRGAFFYRLWRCLHADPRRLPTTWAMRGDRLVCRFRPLTPEQERWVQIEAVADRPEIELRIVAAPRQKPFVAEVVFPADMAPVSAKEFLFQEMQEAALHTQSPAAHWEEKPDRLVFRIALAPDPKASPSSLTGGIREFISSNARRRPDGPAWQTCRFEFDRAAGWDRERAQRWLADHLNWRDSGRTAYLGVSRRATPALAAFVADLCPDLAAPPCCLSWQSPSENGCPEAPFVRFIPVPRHGVDADERGRREGEGWRSQGGTATVPRVRSARGGAGLEIDLAQPRRLDPLPDDLRAVLPRQGLVNYLEAQAIVNTLEALAANAEFMKAAEEWRGAQRHGSPVVAVIGLCPAQNTLLRNLIERSGPPTRKLSLEVGSPAAFRHRDCFAALISLTRSHSHRAVAYGEGPDALVLALTRPASRLFLFGDLGTLVRRCQWQGAVEHLGEADAERERELLARLLAYVQGNGNHPDSFRVGEGTPP